MKNKPNGKILNSKYILRKAKNGQRREKYIGAAVYNVDKNHLQKEANTYAQVILS